MVDKETNDNYIKVYEDLIDIINQKEDVIQDMTKYIAEKIRKKQIVCVKKKKELCKERKCQKCVRNYFD